MTANQKEEGGGQSTLCQPTSKQEGMQAGVSFTQVYQKEIIRRPHKVEGKLVIAVSVVLLHLVFFLKYGDVDGAFRDGGGCSKGRRRRHKYERNLKKKYQRRQKTEQVKLEKKEESKT